MIIKNKPLLFKDIPFVYLKNLIFKIFSYIFIFQLLIIIFLFIFYINSGFSKKYPFNQLISLINQKQKHFTGFDISKIPSYLSASAYGIYYSVVGVDIENFFISINQKNVIFLNAQRGKKLGKIDNEDIDLKKMVNANAKINNESFRIKLRVKGDRSLHYYDPLQTSYKIDVRGNKRIFGLEEFSIQKPITRNYVYEFMFHKLNSFVGNLSLNYKLINLYFNGDRRGIYAIEEGFGKELIERNSRRFGPIFGLNEIQSLFYPNVLYEAFSENYWISNNEALLRSAYSTLNNIKLGLNEINNNNFDLNSWAKYFAVMDLIGAHHGGLSKSVRLYFNPVNGKFEPVPFDGHVATGSEQLSDFIILDFLKDKTNCSYICEERDWFLKFLKNNDDSLKTEFIEKYILQLIKLTKADFINNFLNKYKEEIDQFNKAIYSEFSKSDQIFGKGITFYVYDKSLLYGRAKMIKKKLNTHNLNKFSFSLKDETLKIFNPSNNLAKIVNNCNNANEKPIWISGNIEINWERNCKSLKLKSILGSTQNILLYDNPSLDVKKVINYNNFQKINKIVSGKYIENVFYPSGDEIIIFSSVYISKDEKIIFTENQDIILKNNSIIYSEGDLEFKGSKDKPIKISGSNSKNTIISLNADFKATNLIIKDLGYPALENRILYGGINLINSKVYLKNVYFNNSLGEDAINLINSNTEAINIYFNNIFSDGIDVDFGKLKFFNINCKNVINDCLDTSGAIIEGRYLVAKNIGDKVLSIGEKSTAMVEYIKSENANIGLVSKDDSTLKVSNIEFMSTKVPIAVYNKKKEFGPAKLFINDMQLKNSPNLFIVDKNSQLTIDGRKINNKTSDNKIIDLVY